MLSVASPELPARVAVVVPARNEADVVADSVSSLLQQNWAGKIDVFLVDDNSSDGTGEAALSAAQNIGKADRLHLIDGTSLPPGWSGKLWALQQGIEQALKLNPQFLLLTDADVVHASASVGSLVAAAEAGRCDLASVMVKLHCQTFAEKLLIPAFVFYFFKLYPPSWIADPGHGTAGAAGGCVLLRPSALARAGGIEAIRSEIIDDCALARAVKRSGGRLWLGLTDSTVSLRRYESFSEIRRMIARTAFNQLHHSALLLVVATLGMTIIYLAPPLLLLTGRLLPMALGTFAWLLMTIAYMPIVGFYGLSPAWALTMPLSAAFYLLATLDSALSFWSGRGGEWKGRIQDTTNRESGNPVIG